MSSIWSSAAAHASTSPLTSAMAAPTPGGGAAAKYQSILQSAGKQGTAQAGLSPKASSAAVAANPMDASSSSDSSSDSDATISANDFLTLLVTEMQNQDPTADTDPNEYINQLVQINSLEQLISINQNLTTVLGAAASPTSQMASAGLAASTAAVAPVSAKNTAGMQTSGLQGKATAASAIQSAGAADRPAKVHGNLTLPANTPAAHKVARALDGSARGHGHAVRDIPTQSLP
jgi:flagellar basal-body rod modification protein FlgD